MAEKSNHTKVAEAIKTATVKGKVQLQHPRRWDSPNREFNITNIKLRRADGWAFSIESSQQRGIGTETRRSARKPDDLEFSVHTHSAQPIRISACTHLQQGPALGSVDPDVGGAL